MEIRSSRPRPDMEDEGSSEEAQQPKGADANRAGLRMTDVLQLPDPLRETITWMIRKREVRLADLAERLQQDEAAARSTLADLVARGYLWETRVDGETRYRVRLAPQRKQPSRLLDL